MKPGYGVIARYDRHRILVGNSKLVEKNGIVLDEESVDCIADESALGRTAVVAKDSEAIGIISIADSPRPEIELSIAQMKDAGAKEVVMLTGDNLAAAKSLSEK